VQALRVEPLVRPQWRQPWQRRYFCWTAILVVTAKFHSHCHTDWQGSVCCLEHHSDHLFQSIVLHVERPEIEVLVASPMVVSIVLPNSLAPRVIIDLNGVCSSSRLLPTIKKRGER